MVYLLHFEKPYCHARHYMGFTDNLDRRLAEHRNGSGSRLMEVISQAGIGWELARTWPKGDRALERKLKKQKHAWRHCPICRAERHMREVIELSKE
jgi:predicted GIY-YIG superfamily endonuclease